MKRRTTLRNRQSIFSTPSLWALTLLLTACGPGSSDGDGVGGSAGGAAGTAGASGTTGIAGTTGSAGTAGTMALRGRRGPQVRLAPQALQGLRERRASPVAAARRARQAPPAARARQAPGAARAERVRPRLSRPFPTIRRGTAVSGRSRPRATPATPPRHRPRRGVPAGGREVRPRRSQASDHRLGQRPHEHRRHLAGIPRASGDLRLRRRGARTNGSDGRSHEHRDRLRPADWPTIRRAATAARSIRPRSAPPDIHGAAAAPSPSEATLASRLPSSFASNGKVRNLKAPWGVIGGDMDTTFNWTSISRR